MQKDCQIYLGNIIDELSDAEKSSIANVLSSNRFFYQTRCMPKILFATKEHSNNGQIIWFLLVYQSKSTISTSG